MCVLLYFSDYFFSSKLKIIIFLYFFSDIPSLAKAAVAGDEAALDMLSWRKSNKGSSQSSDYSFFFGVADGKLSKPLNVVYFHSFLDRFQILIYFG